MGRSEETSNLEDEGIAKMPRSPCFYSFIYVFSQIHLFFLPTLLLKSCRYIKVGSSCSQVQDTKYRRIRPSLHVPLESTWPFRAVHASTSQLRAPNPPTTAHAADQFAVDSLHILVLKSRLQPSSVVVAALCSRPIRCSSFTCCPGLQHFIFVVN